jgi:tetratricopeptide (TPR) repeat protein
MMNFTLRLPASTVLFFSLVSLPVVLTDKTRALVATSQLVPLELRYRYASLTVYLERLRYPRQLDIQLRITKWLRIVLAGVLVIAALIGVGRITRTWESDRHYKIARNLVDAGDLKAAETEFNIALKLNQEHSDARSAYGAFLLRQGRYREGLEQLLQVNKRLDSLEIHERLAEAYGILGEPKKELEQWRIFFSRRPQNRFAHPAEYDRYLKLLRQ